MRHCLEATFYDPQVDDAPLRGRVVAWGTQAVDGREFAILAGYADPIIAVREIEGAITDDSLIWIALTDKETNAYPVSPMLQDLCVVRGATYVGGLVRAYDPGMGAGDRLGTQPASGAEGASGDDDGRPDDAASRQVDLGPEPVDTAAATKDAFAAAAADVEGDTGSHGHSSGGFDTSGFTL